VAASFAIRAGKAFVELFTKDIELQKGLKRAEQKLTAFGSAVGKIGASIGGLGAGITAPLLGAAKTFADSGSALNDMSTRTGVAVETLSVLSFAAKQSGTDMETVEGALRKMSKALVAGSEENLQAEATFKALGLSVSDLIDQSPEKQFQAIAAAIGEIPNPTGRAAAAMQIFGKSGTALLPIIEDMDALTSQARAMGLVMSTEDAKAADKLGDSIDLVGSMVGRLSEVIGAALAPLLTDVAEDMANVVKAGVEWVQQNRDLVVTALKVGAVITGVGTAIVGIGAAFIAAGAAINGVTTVLGAVSAGFGLLLNPIVLVGAALVGLTLYFQQSADIGGKALAFLGEQFGSLLDVANQTIGGIADALKAGDIQLAAQILWAGLKVEWLKGVAFLQGVWDDWGKAALDVFTNVKTAIATAWIETTGFIGDFWTALIGRISAAWQTFTNFFGEAWDTAVAAVEKTLITVGGFFTQEFTKLKLLLSGAAFNAEQRVAANRKAIEETTAALAAVDSGLAQKREARAQQPDRTTELSSEIFNREQDRKDQIAALQSGAEAEKAARRQPSEDAGAALKAAQDELAGLVGQAAKEAAAAPKFGGGQAPGGEFTGFTPETVQQGVEQAKSKVDVAGSFSAAALRGLGAGSSVADDQLKEQKTTNDQLDKLNKTIDKKKAVFT
jgi:hypothetical protein